MRAAAAPLLLLAALAAGRAGATRVPCLDFAYAKPCGGPWSPSICSQSCLQSLCKLFEEEKKDSLLECDFNEGFDMFALDPLASEGKDIRSIYEDTLRAQVELQCGVASPCEGVDPDAKPTRLDVPWPVEYLAMSVSANRTLLPHGMRTSRRERLCAEEELATMLQASATQLDHKVRRENLHFCCHEPDRTRRDASVVHASVTFYGDVLQQDHEAWPLSPCDDIAFKQPCVKEVAAADRTEWSGWRPDQQAAYPFHAHVSFVDEAKANAELKKGIMRVAVSFRSFENGTKVELAELRRYAEAAEALRASPPNASLAVLLLKDDVIVKGARMDVASVSVEDDTLIADMRLCGAASRPSPDADPTLCAFVPTGAAVVAAKGGAERNHRSNVLFREFEWLPSSRCPA